MSSRQPDPRDPRPLIGEPLSLDLLNTRWGINAAARDLLDDLAGYEIWLSSAGLGDRCEPDAAGLAATRTARAALAAATRAADDPVHDGPRAGTLLGLNEVLQHGKVLRQLSVAGPLEAVEVDSEAWLAGWLAVDDYLGLLTRGPERIRVCAHPECVLHFFDVSQNGRRRWCSMAGCGNRAKAARHYARGKDERG